MDVNVWWASWWIKAAAYAGLAMFGGTIGYAMRMLDSKSPISLGRAVLEGLAAGFVGFLVMLVCNATGFSEEWTGVIVGVAGWLGANASIRMLEKVVFRRIDMEPPAEGKEPADAAKN